MRSIQTKFIALILGCVLLCSLVIGGAGIYNAQHMADTDSAQIMNLQCSDKAREMNALLSRIEPTGKPRAVSASGHLESAERLKAPRVTWKATPGRWNRWR